MSKQRSILCIALVMLLALTGCGKTTPAPVATPQDPTPAKLAPLTIGLMPAINSIPLIVAEHNGYFKQLGLEVKLMHFSSQNDREAALQTGQIDGTVTDVINVVTERDSGFKVKITSATDSRFALLASQKSGITSVTDLKSKAAKSLRTGSIEGSVITYETDLLLKKNGVDPKVVDLVSIPAIPARLEALRAGQIDAALLPDPLATLAEKQGAKLILDTKDVATVPGALVFTENSIAGKKASLQAFYKAYDMAVAEVNKNAAAYKDVITEKGQFPPDVKDTLKLPQFGTKYLPDRSEVTNVISWMKGRYGLKTELKYEDIVTEEFMK
ncbi:MAG: ABC transporter substrate-binding protein [Bacillota bacterium]